MRTGTELPGICNTLTAMAQSHDQPLFNHAMEGLYIILRNFVSKIILRSNLRPRSSLNNARVVCSMSTHCLGCCELPGCAGAGCRRGDCWQDLVLMQVTALTCSVCSHICPANTNSPLIRCSNSWLLSSSPCVST